MTQRAIRATYMRGGTSKGLFFRAEDLPSDKRERDLLLLRAIGSPDPYQKHTDGMGGATSSTSKVVILSPSLREDCDVDFLFGAVAISAPLIDWSGNCGNLSAAVGPFAIAQGWVRPLEGTTKVRIWQQNIQKRIVALVPTRQGQVVEEGTFQEDGVPFPSAEITLEFLEPADSGPLGLLPTGNPSDLLDLPDGGQLRVTMLNAGNPTVFVRADSLKLTGRELPDAINRDARMLARLEAIRSLAAVAMGLARSADDATRNRPATPKIAFIAPPAAYRTSAGADVAKEQIDLLARIVSMGKLHHAFTGTGSIALAVAAALPGTVVAEVARTLPGVPTRIGHASGVLAVGAILEHEGRGWRVEKAVMSRSARRLMQGEIFVPSA
ncbi:MAG: 2-methylaconitate cis-trans isomerase PrpF [Burkholderiaceae bacterium]|jgi:probable AcnD-accessory protein PrpF